MKLIIKRGICCFVIVTLLLGIVPFAMAEILSAGEVVDSMTPPHDKLFTSEIFEENCTISKEEVFGKSGSYYLNHDETKIVSVGEELYRTYTFSDETSFILAVGTIFAAFDEFNLIDDWGVRLYYIEDEEVSVLSQEVVGQLAAVFVNQVQQW